MDAIFHVRQRRAKCQHQLHLHLHRIRAGQADVEVQGRCRHRRPGCQQDRRRVHVAHLLQQGGRSRQCTGRLYHRQGQEPVLFHIQHGFDVSADLRNRRQEEQSQGRRHLHHRQPHRREDHRQTQGRRHLPVQGRADGRLHKTGERQPRQRDFRRLLRVRHQQLRHDHRQRMGGSGSSGHLYA